MFFLLLPFLCIFSFVLLVMLAVIDFRTFLLPNKYVFAFFLCGVIFHVLSGFSFVSLYVACFGFLAGGGLLLVIRVLANAHYKQDALGLGDVKLMAAAGFWLGLEGIFMAITLGALAGLVHGVLYKFICHKQIPLSRLSIPAGPGFIVGILAVAFYQFRDLPKILLDLYGGNMLLL